MKEISQSSPCSRIMYPGIGHQTTKVGTKGITHGEQSHLWGSLEKMCKYSVIFCVKSGGPP